ncbi:MAG: DMT family transporter [Treponema sp.]|nr:DMT family transporter [Treponema sp.]
MKNKLISTFAGAGLLLTACIWGVAFVVVKDSLDYVPPIYMLAFRFSIAAVGLLLAYFSRLNKLDALLWRHGAMLGLYLFLGYAFQTVGCDYTSAGKNAFLTTVYVIIVPILAWVFQKKRPHLFVFIAAVMSLTGIAMLALGTDALSDTLHINIGDILTLICGFFYAIHILFVSIWSQKQDPLLLTVVQFIVAAILSWIMAPLFDGAFPYAALHSFHVVGSMLYLGVLSTLVCFVLQNVGLKYVPPFLATICLSMESVFGVLFSVLLLGEILTPRMIVGCVLLFAAILFVQIKE